MSAIEDYVNSLRGGGNWDAILNQRAMDALTRASDLTTASNTGRTNLQEESDLNTTQTNDVLEKNTRSTVGNFGGRGTIHSSAYIDAQGENANNASKSLAEIAARRAMGLRTIAENETAGQNDIMGGLTSAATDAAGRTAAARHQAEIDKREASLAQSQLEFQRQGQQMQQDFFNQQIQQQNQLAAQQAAQQAALMRAMQPVMSPGGSYGYDVGDVNDPDSAINKFLTYWKQQEDAAKNSPWQRMIDSMAGKNRSVMRQGQNLRGLFGG